MPNCIHTQHAHKHNCCNTQCTTPAQPNVQRRRIWQVGATHKPSRTAVCAQANKDMVKDNTKISSWTTLNEARAGMHNLRTPQQVLQALQQLSHLASNSEDTTAHLADIQPTFNQFLIQHVDGLQPKELIQAAYLLGSLPGSDSRVVLQLCEGCYDNLDAVACTSLSSLVSVLSKLGARPSDRFLAAFMHTLESQLSSLTAGQQASVLVSLVHLGVRPSTQWLHAWEDASRTEHQDLSCTELAQVLVALSRIGFTPGPAWFAGYLAASQYWLTQASARQLADIAFGLGCMGLRDMVGEAWRQKLLQVSLERMGHMNSNELARLLSGAAALHLQPSSNWLYTAAQHALDALQHSSPRDVLDVLLALIQLTPANDNAIDRSPTGQYLSSLLFTAWSKSQATDTLDKGRQASGNTPQANSMSILMGQVFDRAVVPQPQPSGTTVHAPHTAHSNGSHTSLHQRHLNDLPQIVSTTNGHTGTPHTPQQILGIPSWCSAVWRRKLIQHTEDRLSTFTAQGLVQLLIGLAIIKASPGHAWLGTYVRLLPDKLSVLAPSELAGLPSALLHTKYNSSMELLQRLQSESCSKLSLMSDVQLLGFASAMQQMSMQLETSSFEAELVWRQAYLVETQKRFGRLTFEQLAALPYIVVRLRLQPADTWWSNLFSSMLQHPAPQHMQQPLGNKVHTQSSPNQSSSNQVADDTRNNSGYPNNWTQLTNTDLTQLIWAVTLSGTQPPTAWLTYVMNEAGRRVNKYKRGTRSHNIDQQTPTTHTRVKPIHIPSNKS